MVYLPLAAHRFPACPFESIVVTSFPSDDTRVAPLQGLMVHVYKAQNVEKGHTACQLFGLNTHNSLWLNDIYCFAVIYKDNSSFI